MSRRADTLIWPAKWAEISAGWRDELPLVSHVQALRILHADQGVPERVRHGALRDVPIFGAGLHAPKRLDLPAVRVVQVEVDGALLEARPLRHHRELLEVGVGEAIPQAMRVLDVVRRRPHFAG